MLCIVVLFRLGWRDVSDRSKQAAMIKPIDPAECRHFEILHVAPRPLTMDQLSFVEAVYRLSESIVIGIADTVDRWFDASFGQTLSVSNGQILPTTIRVMNQSGLVPF